MRRHALFAVAVLALAACHHKPEVPKDRMLLRIDGEWMNRTTADGEPVRKARSTIVIFRSSGEYVEHHAWLIERPDTTLYMSSGDPHVIAVGRWTQENDAINARRHSIARTPRQLNAPTDPLCSTGALTFVVSGNAVTGRAGEQQDGIYAPVTRLVAPDFESYVDLAKKSPLKCEVPPPS